MDLAQCLLVTTVTVQFLRKQAGKLTCSKYFGRNIYMKQCTTLIFLATATERVRWDFGISHQTAQLVIFFFKRKLRAYAVITSFEYIYKKNGNSSGLIHSIQKYFDQCGFPQGFYIHYLWNKLVNAHNMLHFQCDHSQAFLCPQLVDNKN